MKNGEEGASPLMGGQAPPSDSSAYISIPVTEEPPHNGNPKPSNPTLADLDDGPLVLPPFSFATQQADSRRDPNNRFPRSKLVLLLLGLLLLVIVVTLVSVVLRSRLAAQAEAKRLYEIRAFKQRTAFHFQPDKNWMNDPNGPMYYQGYYHLFYQYNPKLAAWGIIIWGHAVSKDLVNWKHLEPALEPDQWYDQKGVWSGSATILPDGTPVLLYTGLSNSSTQIQSMALPANTSDPLLRQWSKAPQNPIARVPDGYAADSFRDPTTAWRGNDSVWRMLVGANSGENGTIGTALLYKSVDFQTWNYAHRALHSVAGTGMWECPDFFPVPVSGVSVGNEFHTDTHGPSVKHVLKVSASDKLHDYYSVGTYATENDSFSPESVNLDAGIGLRYDYGKLYASKSFYDEWKQRRVLFGWVNESDPREVHLEKKWASVMSIPRQVWLDNRTTTDLIQYPVEEVNSLRNTEVSAVNVTVGAGSSVKLDGIVGNQLDMEITFPMPNAISQGLQPPELLDENGQLACSSDGTPGSNTVMGPFGVYVLATDDLLELTALSFHVLQSPGEGLKILFCSDQSRSSVASNLDTSMFGSFVRVYESDQFLTLRILVDHSIVETFVQGGRTVVTARVYPQHALDNAAGVFLFNNGTEVITATTVRVWNMSTVNITQFSG